MTGRSVTFYCVHNMEAGYPWDTVEIPEQNASEDDIFIEAEFTQENYDIGEVVVIEVILSNLSDSINLSESTIRFTRVRSKLATETLQFEGNSYFSPSCQQLRGCKPNRRELKVKMKLVPKQGAVVEKLEPNIHISLQCGNKTITSTTLPFSLSTSFFNLTFNII
jgi:hypothetical protein